MLWNVVEMTTKKVDFSEIDPEFKEENWKCLGSFKAEYIYDDLYTNVPKEHWIRKILKTKYLTADVGQSVMFIDTDHPGELVRIVGYPPEYCVLLFEKR